MRYELFSRLNTGGAILTDQEIRNCIFRSGLKGLYEFIDLATNYNKFIELTALSEKQRLELYNQELVIRYISLIDEWRNVDSSISLHMTSFLKNMLDKKEDVNGNMKERFYATIDILYPFGKEVFRFQNSSICSSSLYDAIMVGVSENFDYYKENHGELKRKIDFLKEDEQFKKNSGVASSSKNRAKKRISRAVEIFGEIENE